MKRWGLEKEGMAGMPEIMSLPPTSMQLACGHSCLVEFHYQRSEYRGAMTEWILNKCGF